MYGSSARKNFSGGGGQDESLHPNSSGYTRDLSRLWQPKTPTCRRCSCFRCQDSAFAPKTACSLTPRLEGLIKYQRRDDSPPSKLCTCQTADHSLSGPRVTNIAAEMAEALKSGNGQDISLRYLLAGCVSTILSASGQEQHTELSAVSSLGTEARRLSVPWPYALGIYVEHLSSVPPSTQAQRSKPSQRCKGPLQKR
jgi:hypothetical protein